MSTSVAVFVGSLRKGAFTGAVADALAELGHAKGLHLETVAIGDLPLYNPDLDEGTPPAPWTAFREKVAGFNAVLFVTPEYNRSVPAALKNALDVGSRPYGKSVWGGKPGAVVSVSPGALAAFGANHHLRQSLVFLDVPVLQQPEAYIGGVGGLLDDKGKLSNENTVKFLGKFLEKFATWIERNRKA